MTIASDLLPEFDLEMQSTRKLLAIVPAARAAWRPHAKSWTLGDLSMHIANLAEWMAITLTTTELDFNPPGGPQFPVRKFASPEATLAEFDANVQRARAALAKSADADFAVVWSLKNAGQKILAVPRSMCVRGFVMNHMIHHRGQLSLYL